jgi:hypothetical protein
MAHAVDKDLFISSYGDEDDSNRGECVVNESLKTILRLVPPPRERAVQPYHVGVGGLYIDALKVIPELVSVITLSVRSIDLIPTFNSWIMRSAV